VITVFATNEVEANIIKELFDSDEYDFWTSPRKLGATDIMASPEQLPILMRLFVKNGMKHEVKIANVEKLVQEERESNKRGAIGRVGWTAYHRHAEIEDWLSNDLVSPFAEVSVIGQTFQKRNIHVVKFSKGGAPKKSVLIDANIHAREWISGATATWIINELDTNMEAQAILDDLDIYIIPLINADGYEWAHTNDRMWRKTRSVRSGSTCVGCDPNRNFGFHFGESQNFFYCFVSLSHFAPYHL
jgi:carboxypeptidase A2